MEGDHRGHGAFREVELGFVIEDHALVANVHAAMMPAGALASAAVGGEWPELPGPEPNGFNRRSSRCAEFRPPALSGLQAAK
jgi:hypothetical protein